MYLNPKVYGSVITEGKNFTEEEGGENRVKREVEKIIQRPNYLLNMQKMGPDQSEPTEHIKSTFTQTEHTCL